MIVQILNGKKKLPTRRIQTLVEHLLPFNFRVQYLPGNKMHIADRLSRLAGMDLEPSVQLIPMSFNVHTRSSRPLKLYYANKHKPSILYTTKTTIPKTTYTKPVVITAKLPHAPKVQTHTSKPSTSGKTPPVPIGILGKAFPPKPLLQQKEVRKSLVNPNLTIPHTLPPLDLPPPDSAETIETYRSPNESLYHKPLLLL